MEMQMGWLPFFKQLQLQCSFAYTSPLFVISAEKANLSIREIAKSAIHLSQSQHTGIRKPNTYRPTLRMCDMCCRVQASAANGHQMTQQHCQSNRNKWSQQSGLVLLLLTYFFPLFWFKAFVARRWARMQLPPVAAEDPGHRCHRQDTTTAHRQHITNMSRLRLTVIAPTPLMWAGVAKTTLHCKNEKTQRVLFIYFIFFSVWKACLKISKRQS